MKNLLTEPTRVIIPVPTAIERTTNWRNFMKSIVTTTDYQKIPKAVYISKADIQDMAREFEADDNLVGVRAYFTLNTPTSEDYGNEVKFVMAMVKINADKPFGEDVIYAPVNKGEESTNVGVVGASNVFDFTKPCPDCCDASSPLFKG